jgi:hypothetical protein
VAAGGAAVSAVQGQIMLGLVARGAMALTAEPVAQAAVAPVVRASGCPEAQARQSRSLVVRRSITGRQVRVAPPSSGVTPGPPDSLRTFSEM